MQKKMERRSFRELTDLLLYVFKLSRHLADASRCGVPALRIFKEPTAEQYPNAEDVRERAQGLLAYIRRIIDEKLISMLCIPDHSQFLEIRQMKSPKV